MAYQLQPLGLTNANPAQIENCLSRLMETERPRYRRLWNYFANPLIPRSFDSHETGVGRPYVQGQEWGLPSRITGAHRGAINSIKRKEVVIENDIAWRINTMVILMGVYGQARKRPLRPPKRRKKPKRTPKPYPLRPLKEFFFSISRMVG